MDRRELLKYGTVVSAAAAGSLHGLVARAAGFFPEEKAVKEDLRKSASLMFKKNEVRSSIGFFHLPSYQTYRAFYAWDSGWHVIAMSHLDADKAISELSTIYSVQADDGHIPHEVRVPKLSPEDPMRKAVVYAVRRQYDDEGKSAFIDPPSFLLAAELLYRKHQDPRVLEFIPAMERCCRYLTEDRDLFGDGLVSIIHPWESGTDMAPVFDEPMDFNMKNPFTAVKAGIAYPRLLNFCAEHDWDPKKLAQKNRFVFEDVGMNSLTARGLQSLSYLCRQSGDAAKADKWESKARSMVEAMEEIFWDEGASFFYPRYDVKSPKLSRHKCMTGALPLLTGLVSEDKAKKLIEKNLLSKKHFYGERLVPFNSRSELEGENIPLEDTLIWRGHCIWTNMSWMAARLAENYGYTGYPVEVTRSTVRLIKEQGFHEFYDPRTGEGKGAPNFTWPALAVDLMEEYGL
ncbi:MAG: trehalase family glycosidase [bacterium]